MSAGMSRAWLAGVAMSMSVAAGAAVPGERGYEQVRTARIPNGLPLTQFRYANGLQLYVIENPAAPVFTFQTWFNVGSMHEKLDPKLRRTGLAHLFEHMMFRGTTNHGDGEFDRLLTEAGLDDGNATTWLDRTNYYSSLPKERLDLILGLESDRMVNLDIVDDVLDTERGAVLGELHAGLDDPDTVAFDELYATAFVLHPYRYTTIGTETEIRSFTRDEAMYFYRTYYAPNNATLLVAGDVKAADVAARVQRFYGAIPSQPIPAVVAPAEPKQTIERFREFTHDQLLGEKLLIGYHAPGARDPDQAALQVVYALLALGEGSALNSAWVNTGLATDLSGFVNQFRDPGLFVLAAEIQPGRSATELLGALDRTLARLVDRLSPAELERARNQLLLQLQSQWEQNAELASHLGEFIAAAGDPLFAFELADAIDRVTEADVARVIRSHLSAGNRTVVVGKPATRRGGLPGGRR